MNLVANYKKNVKLLSIFNFLIGFSLFMPLAIIYFSKVSGSFTLGASILGVIMFSGAVFEIPTGILSDKVGRKYTVVLGSWARLFTYICYAIGLSYWWLLAGAILEGLSRAFYSGNNDALLYDSLSEIDQLASYDEFQGKVSSTEQLAMGISAIFSGLVAVFSYSSLLWFTVLIQVALLYISYKFVEPPSHRKLDSNVYTHVKEAISLFIKNKKLRLLSLASILGYSISELRWNFASAFVATVWPVWAIGISKTLPSFGASISFYFSGKILKKFKAVKILLFDSIFGKTINIIALIFPSILSPILMSLPSVLYGVGSVAEKTLMQLEFTNHQRATMSSLNSLGGSLGFAITSLVLGGLADAFGPRTAMIIMTLISFPIVYLYWLIFKKDKDLVV